MISELPDRPAHRHDAVGYTSKGYTLVELIVVMVIAGILAVTGYSRYASTASFNERGFADETLGAIYYAHSLARASGCHLRVQMGGGNLTVSSWAACIPSDHSDPDTPITHPQTSGTFVTPVPSGLTVGALDIYFDGRGRPYTTSTETLTSAVSALAIGGRSLSIEPQTGYVHD